ncbi:MAG TPA: MFS transporter [Rubrobacteraceae bacterium]|nr:MFS transporter [Rubrobacteraceae bacterium]
MTGDAPTGRRAVLLAISVATCGVIPAFLTGGLAVQIRDELNFGEGALGLAVAVFFASSSLASFLSGRIVERVGYSLGMRAAVLASAASLLGVALLAGSWLALIFCLAFGGLANAISHPATHLFMARRISQGRQGLAFGVKQAAIPTATLLAGLAVPSLGTTVGWRWAFVAAAVLALVVSLLVPKGGSVAGLRRPRDRAIRTGDARLGPLLLLALGMALGSAAANPFGVFVVESSVAAGIEVGAAGLLLAAGSGVGIGVRVLLGWLTDRRESGSLNLVAGMMVLGTLGFLLLADGARWALVIGVMLAFGAGWGWPGLFNFAVVKTSPGAPAAATGVTQTGASGGAAIGPLVFGLIAEGFSFGMAWLVSGALILLAAAAILVGRRMLLRDRRAQDPERLAALDTS